MIVLDSSFIIDFYNERDAHHRSARALMDRFLSGEWGRGLLLEYVFLEITTVLLVRRNLTVAAGVGRQLLDASELEFVPCSDLFSRVFDAFARQAKTRMSFADAAIAHIALERAGGLVLSFDEEFSRFPGIRIPAAIVQ